MEPDQIVNMEQLPKCDSDLVYYLENYQLQTLGFQSTRNSTGFLHHQIYKKYCHLLNKL
jgi:hypothetical protein